MWPGPYGEWGSRKYLLASLDQSLQRHGPRLRRHLLLAPLRPRHAARGDDGRARHRGAPGQGALRRHLLLLGASAPRRPSRILRDLGTPLLIHQPSYSMLNRWIEADLLDVLGREGVGVHRLLAARAGHAHRPLPRRHPARTRARRASGVAVDVDAHRREPRARPRAERDRAAPRPDAGPAGAGLGAARPARDLGADRRQQRRAARGQRRRARRAWTSTTTSWPRSTSTRWTPGSTSGSGRARREGWCCRAALRRCAALNSLIEGRECVAVRGAGRRPRARASSGCNRGCVATVFGDAQGWPVLGTSGIRQDRPPPPTVRRCRNAREVRTDCAARRGATTRAVPP